MKLEQFRSKVNTFKDSDEVECCYVQDVVKEFPGITLDDLYQKSWDYQDKTGSVESLTSVFDARLIIMLSDMGENLKDVEYTECKECSICGNISLPDDEMYVDVDTSDCICDRHSTFDDDKKGYVSIY